MIPPLPGSSPVSNMPGFEHRYLDANGVRSHYVRGGAGPLIVLLHGWPSSWREWRTVLPLFANAGFSVIAPDLRGMGDSDKPDDGYDKHNVADDIRAIVAAEGGGAVDLIGTDIGAMVAFAWALRHPDEVLHLVLAETLLPGFGLEELMNPATGGYWHFGFHAQVALATMLTEGKEARYLGGMWSMFAPDGGIDDQDRAEWLRTYAAPGGMRGGFKHYEALLADGKANLQAFERQLAMPVLVLSGAKGIPQRPLLDGANRAAANVRSITLADAGHAFALGAPEATVMQLLPFLRNDSDGDATPVIDGAC